MLSREQLIATTFVELADTLVADQRGELQMVASSTEEARLLELYELQSSAKTGEHSPTRHDPA